MPSITSVGLRLTDKMIRISVGTRLGARTCEPYTYVSLRQGGRRKRLHDISCRKSAARHQRHSHLNDIIWRAVKRAQIPAVKEPINLSRDDGKRPDGVSLISWAKGKAVAWDVTIVDTFAQSHIGDTSSPAGAAANHAATLKTSKCANITDSNIFVPIAIETGSAWDQQAIEFIQEL